MNKKRFLGWVLLALLVAWTVFILTRSMKPAPLSSQESQDLLALLLKLFPWMTDHIVRKIAHFTEFFLLGGLLGGVCALFWRPMFWQPLLVGVGVAVCDELLQLGFDGRSCEVKDMLLDGLGVLTALLLLWWILSRRRKE